MNTNEKSLFAQVLMGIGEIYDKEITNNLVVIYWQVLKDYDLATIKQATQHHIRDPQQGAFFPKPAHLIAMCHEIQKSTAAFAWGKIEKALQRVGHFGRIAFDDAIIHIIIDEMGGWLTWCRQNRDQLSKRWPHFQKIYQYYAKLPALPDYHSYVSGAVSYGNEPVVLIGDNQKAIEIMRRGSEDATALVTIPQE